MSTPMIYLRLTMDDGKVVLGDSEMAGYEGLIGITGMSWEVSATHDEKGKRDAQRPVTAQPPKLEPKKIKLTKYFDSASTVLYKHAGLPIDKRKPFKVATITMLSMALIDEDGRNKKMFEVTLQGGFIESLSLKTHDSGDASSLDETVELTFEEMKLTYMPLKAESATQEALSFEMTTDFFEKA